MRAVAGAAVTSALVLSLAACTDGEADADPPSSPPASSAETTPPERPEPDRVIVGHATRPQLDLTARVAKRIIEGRIASFRGHPVAVGLRAVRRDPDAIAVVPLHRVGPSVVAARVGGVDPVRDAPGAVDVTLTGDIMLVRGVPDPAESLAPMSKLLRRADLTVGNLESTLSLNGEPTQGGDSFGGTPALLRPLEKAGFDALSLANNHAGDYGSVALVETVQRMARSPIVPFGAGATLREASRPAVLEVGDTSFAFVGFNAIGETPQAVPGEPGALSVRMPPRTGPELSQDDLDHVLGIIRRADRRGEVVVALPHWGDQYTHTPEPIQRVVSRQLVAAGADLVVGGHPHWVQGMDDVRGVPVIHSLGNFVFDMDFSEPALEGVVMETTWWGKQLKAFRLVPYAMEIGPFVPRVVDGDRAADILGDVWGASTGPYAD
ncbi:MAG: CapA family protein [Actinomycetota bacterium]|nr:CapA family protein [Actinomycetota bacterium]